MLVHRGGATMSTVFRRRAAVAVAAAALAVALATGEGRSRQPQGAGKAQGPKTFLLTNKAKDIRVISDREESVVDFFRRSHIVVGGFVEDMKALLEAKEPLKEVFLNYTSFNDDRKKELLFGAFLEVAPPAEPVAKLIR